METLDLNDDELKALGKKLGAGVKTEEELVNLTKTLRRVVAPALQCVDRGRLLWRVQHLTPSQCSYKSDESFV